MAKNDRPCEPSFFTTTVGQAALLRKGRPAPFQTILELLNTQAEQSRKLPALGFFEHESDGNDANQLRGRLLSFSEVRLYSLLAADKIRQDLKLGLQNGATDRLGKTRRTIALLMTSSAEQLFIWLGLTQLQCRVLFLSSTTGLRGIKSLCQSCDVSTLLYDEKNTDLAQAAFEAESESTVSLVRYSLPLSLLSRAAINCEPQPPCDVNADAVAASDDAAIFHTSGTTSGKASPIIQTHHDVVGVCHNYSDQPQKASLCTSPLFMSGGTADVMRSWTSGCLIWIFPAQILPVSGASVLCCLKAAEAVSGDNSDVPPISYFSCVPYVLEMILDEPDGLSILQKMDMVGVGGAAMPESLANRLVDEGVKLISRYGNTENGFLMTSDRDFATDKAWDYLRPIGEGLTFEDRDDGKAELVISNRWPQICLTNREDGSYATSDLFLRHPTIPNAWKLCGRANAMIVLSTGKKVDPVPLETSLIRSELVKEALLLGKERPYLALLLVPASSQRKDQFLDGIWDLIERFNSSVDSSMKIDRDQVAILSEEYSFPRNAKGGVIRAEAETQNMSFIEAIYGQDTPNGNSSPDREFRGSAAELETKLRALIHSATGKAYDFPAGSDFFHHGIDSMACVRIRQAIQQKLLSSKTGKLPLNVIYDCGTLTALTNYVFQRLSNVPSKDALTSSSVKLDDEMVRLVQRYSISSSRAVQLPRPAQNGSQPKPQTVVLTGATGMLGAHILHSLLENQSIERIICLVRATSDHAAEGRIGDALQKREIKITFPSNRVVCLAADLSQADLGLTKAVLENLRQTCTNVIHAAWTVNFQLQLSSFEHDNIAGIHNLLVFALSANSLRKFVFCSSAAVGDAFEDTPPAGKGGARPAPKKSSILGYVRSKWVAEEVCATATASLSSNQGVIIARVGQLCGDRVNGNWNVDELWPLVLSSSKLNDCLPRLKQTLDWLPVDQAAEQIVSLFGDRQLPASAELQYATIANADESATWLDLLDWVKQLDPTLSIVEPGEWLAKLQAVQAEGSQHTSLRVLGMWDSLAIEPASEAQDSKINGSLKGSADIAEHGSGIVNEELVKRIYRWLQREKLL